MDSGIGDNDNKNPSEVPETLLNIVHKNGAFRFPNGDKYSGGYEARKMDFTVVKQGYGEYMTWDGHVYKGHWINDKLDPNEQLTIEFCDGSYYQGSISDGMYSGNGIYVFPDRTILSSEFAGNLPIGVIEFIDKQGFTWVGGVRNNIIKLLTLNRFYTTCPKKAEDSVDEDKNEDEGINIAIPPT